MEIETGAPLRPWRQKAVAEFLSREALDYDPAIPFTVNLLEDDRIVATGSLDGNICKCIAVDPAFQGEGLTATIITQLIDRFELTAEEAQRYFGTAMAQEGM